MRKVLIHRHWWWFISLIMAGLMLYITNSPGWVWAGKTISGSSGPIVPNSGSSLMIGSAVPTTVETPKVPVGLQVVIRLSEGLGPEQVAMTVGAQVLRRGPLNYATLGFPVGVVKEQVFKQLSQFPGIQSAEENQRIKIQTQTQILAQTQTSAMTVTDSKYTKQWSLANAEVPSAWEMGATGKGITIAVIDTGIDLQHPDLADNIVPGYNALTGSAMHGANRDNNGHGTHVAGIAAAALNGIGIVGVAYQAKIMPIKTMDKDGEGFDDAIAEGIVWAADHGAKIINLSLGSSGQTDILTHAIAYAINQGCLLVAAAGNFNPDTEKNPGVTYPAADPEVLAVSAADRYDQIAGYSCTGPQVVLAAPGSGIVSDWLNSTYALVDGTSMAAPFVSGEAALIWSLHPGWNRQQIIQALEGGVRVRGSGRDSNYGYGLVNAALALKLTLEPRTLLSPATVDQQGAQITGGDEKTQGVLTIAPQTLSKPTTVTVRVSDLPAPLPVGVSALSSVLNVEWGQTALQKMTTLTVSDVRMLAGLNYQLYRWDGSRWLAVGGQTSNEQISLGIFIPGIYVSGLKPGSPDDLPARLAGQESVNTAIQIAEQAYPLGADTIILARNDNFPDALAGAPLAAKMQAPILLTPSSGLTPDVRAEIAKLSPKTIYLLGGNMAISPGIQLELSSHYVVKRLAGETCFGTAAAIARELGTKGQAVLASGFSFPDALIIASWAASQGVPILLTEAGSLPPETREALNELRITQTLIVGGEKVVGPNVKSQLPFPTRLSGLTRYDTAAAVLQAFPPQGNFVYLATGENYPDALTGSILAAQSGSMLVLVPSVVSLPDRLTNLLSTWKAKKLIALGGDAALPEAVVNNVRKLLSDH
ncbi:MAG: S8 family serine peptidase [Desulfitobacteriaceae bacterium]